MIIRKLNKDKKWPIKTIVIIILVTIFLIVIFFEYPNILKHIDIWTNNYILNNGVNILWKIEKIEEMWYNEFFLVNKDSKILLKNYPQNIDNLIWNNVLINWEVKEIADTELFFIKFIKDLDQNTIIENNIYTFANELVIFNTKEMPSVVPYKQWNKITIYYKNNPLIDISSFGCSKVSASRDCKQLINDFDLNENEYFDSYNWLVYYKIDDNKWELFNDTLLWYYIQTKDDDVLLNISSVIDIINSDYILNNKKDLILNSCEYLVSIDDIDIIWQDWSIIIVDAKWNNKDKQDTRCKTSFDLMKDWKIVKNN